MSGFIEEGKRWRKDVLGNVYKEQRRFEKKVLAPFSTPDFPSPPIPSPAPRTIMAGERAERDEKLRKKRKRATVMGGYGKLTLGKPGLLGV